MQSQVSRFVGKESKVGQKARFSGEILDYRFNIIIFALEIHLINGKFIPKYLSK